MLRNSALPHCPDASAISRPRSPARSIMSSRSAALRSIAWPASCRSNSGRRPRGSSSEYLTRAAAAAAKSNITLLIEPINPRDRAGLFPQPCRARRRSRRQDRRAECARAIRFLSYPDRRRRSDQTLREIPAGRSATCRSPRCRRAASPTRARSIIPRCSRRSTGSAMADGSAANTSRATRTEDGLGWARPYGVVPKRS